MEQQPAAAVAPQEGPTGPPRPQPGLPLPGGPTSTCTICGCDLTGHRLFHIRYRVCPEHATADTVMNKGVPSRFCQQCGRFHPLDAFEPALRSCRQQLARHAARRRERRRLAAAAKAAVKSMPAAGAAQQAGGQQKQRQPRMQQVHQQEVQQAAAAAAVAAPSAGRLAEVAAAERASKRRRTASEASTLSSHEAGAAAATAAALGSGGSSVLQPAAFDPHVPLLPAVPASLPVPHLDPAWTLQAGGLPPPAPQPAVPAWLAAPALPVEQLPPAGTQAQAAEAALLLAAFMRDPAVASLLSPPAQPTPRQQSDPAALPSEGAALSDDAVAPPQQPAMWEAASRPLPAMVAPQLQLASSPPPNPAQALGMQGVAATLPPAAMLPCDLLPIPAPAAAAGTHEPGLAEAAAGLRRAAAQELMWRVQSAQRDYGMECLLLRLAAMSPAECEAQLAQLLAGLAAAGPPL